ncbi:type I restriction endonuclease [Verrucomicrobiaceae bacterium 227]
MSGNTEEPFGEETAIELMRDELGWEVVNAHGEWSGGVSDLGRESKREVVLVSRLEPALRRLNPELPGVAIAAAVEALMLDQSALGFVAANREIDQLLRGGVVVTIPDREVGGQRTEVVRVIDWDDAGANDFLWVSKFWVSGEPYTRRVDLVGFVNGLPLVLMVLKKAGSEVREAYDKNLADFKKHVSRIFHYNAFLLISNGVEGKIGSVTSPWEYFGDWKKAVGEEEEPVISLEVLLRGTCEKGRLLDLVENFVRFSGGEPLEKLVARNHQFHGVNRMLVALEGAEDGRGGVFTHAAGSGEWESMGFFAEKVFRKLGENWTFVILTDLHRCLGDCGEAKGMGDLQRLLGEDHRFVSVCREAFGGEAGTFGLVLSERDDLVVLVVDALRSEDEMLFINLLRTALPRAKFVAFSGTPLSDGEEWAREVFGETVSIYEGAQSVADGVTVPLFYEPRMPELALPQDPGADDGLLAQEDRLGKVAKDLVSHFLDRGYQGKALVMSVDKEAALMMQEKVAAEWEAERGRVLAEMPLVHAGGKEFAALNERLRILNRVEMAVVLSPGEVLEVVERFRDADDPLSLVFVSEMLLAGIDAPGCSTLYLDQPMRGHTLRQTVAVVNRRDVGKACGLIVDYANVFQDLEKALAIDGSGLNGDPLPVRPKSELVEVLQVAIANMRAFCGREDIDLDGVVKESWKHFLPAVNQLMRSDGVMAGFLGNASEVERLYWAVMPDAIIPDLAPVVAMIVELAQAVRANLESPNILAVMGGVADLSSQGIVAEVGIGAGEDRQALDLSQVDFEVLRKTFLKSTTRNIQVQQLRVLIERKLDQLVGLHGSGDSFLDRFRGLVEDFNSGVCSVELMFEALVSFSKEL